MVLSHILKSFPYCELSYRLSYWYQSPFEFFDKKHTSNSTGDMKYILCLIAFPFKTATVMSNGMRTQENQQNKTKNYQVLQQPDADYCNQKYCAGHRRNVIPDRLSFCMFPIALLDSSQRHRAYYFQKVPTFKVT